MYPGGPTVGKHQTYALSFEPGQVVMLPTLEPGDRKAHIIEYPGELIQPKPHKGKFNEYEFRWPNCDGGAVFRSSLSDLPALMLRTHFGGRKFLEARSIPGCDTHSRDGSLAPFVCRGNDQVEDDNSAKPDKSDLKKQRKSAGKYASKRAGR
ncbi:hypothetical protein DFH08DRAFT_804054 [Mycena albidolilacea]|uniref:Uncharacterized protein n=1 Tax=Mycena albidolilacea TaxID=1033008 RepID=A0AAD7AC44_9AGAR|nr:hypothetical protein DFH08DRAFT_804054 [Mycena albidolilacea]